MRFSAGSNKSPRPRCSLLVMAFLFLGLATDALTADYRGHNVDGIQFSAFARSLATGKYYAATVVFGQNRANACLTSGEHLTLKLDAQSVDDPEEIVALDAGGRWWALAIDDLDQPRNKLAAQVQDPQKTECRIHR